MDKNNAEEAKSENEERKEEIATWLDTYPSLWSRFISKWIKDNLQNENQ